MTQFIKLSPRLMPVVIGLILISITLHWTSCRHEPASLGLELSEDTHISMIGGNLCSRMINYGHLETEIYLQHPNQRLVIRNMCDPGDTPGFRPHSGRFSPWAYLGAEEHHNELANFSNSQGHYQTPDQWLSENKTNLLLAFFGYSESFAGPEGLDHFAKEFTGFIDHTLTQNYNGEGNPQIIIVSPLAYQDLSQGVDLPNGDTINSNLRLYADKMKELSALNELPYIDLYSASLEWYKSGKEISIDGIQLNDEGNQKVAKFLAKSLFNYKSTDAKRDQVRQAVNEKNWFWHDDYKSPNGVHVFGRRYNPFGPDNYPDEIIKKKQMTAIRDTAIWAVLTDNDYDVAQKDALTHKLSPVETNYIPGDYGRGEARYLYRDEAEATFNTAPGYQIELFASEEEFPDLANPVQLSFDNKGRLWVAVMPTYPHYKVGDPKPNDKLIILEDTDGDHKADKQTIFADHLHLPIGFELAPEGVYISQGTNLKLLIDTDGDDHADREEIILSGFDDHDTHHAISAFCADPSGAIYMAEGVFLHTNVETPYGTVRATNGGFYRYNPNRKHLERVSQVPIPNPWGIAFDDYGQCFYAETSGPDIRWMLPGSIMPRYGQGNDKGPSLVREEDKVRPTSGLEFVSSRHFPDDVQGDLLINNSIGFLGMRQHKVLNDSSGFKLSMRHDIVQGDDPNFRPVDMEFAPDGSLYMVDWHNVLIGHMQHNARDPLRDHVHGRVYRITYPSRPLVREAYIDDAPIDTLLNNLLLPEYRSRYRTRRELRGRSVNEVNAHLATWIENLDKTHPNYERHLLEALWVSWGHNQVNTPLLNQLLQAKNSDIRAAAVHVLRYVGHQIENQSELLTTMADDPSGRVRLEVLVAATWLDNRNTGLEIVNQIGSQAMDEWLRTPLERARAHLQGKNLEVKVEEIRTHLTGSERELYVQGKELYEQEGYCGTCHQEYGQGLAAAGYPPLKQSKWVTEDPERLIKLTLKGLYGPMVVANRQYDGTVPMTAFEGLMTDEQMAAVLTYVRNSFTNRSSVISAEQVGKVRASIEDKKGFFTPDELLILHPHEKIDNKSLVN